MKLTTKRQTQETDSVLSPEPSPLRLKMGSIRRSSSRRRRSHRTLSEETAGDTAEEKLDPVDEAVVQYSTQQTQFIYDLTLDATGAHSSFASLFSLLCPPCQSTLCWLRCLLTPSAPGEEVRTASLALFVSATTQKPTSGTMSTVFMGMSLGVEPVQL